jgi:hypothetical protein
MKQKINMLFLICLYLSISACSKPVSFTLDKTFTSVFIGSENPLEVSGQLLLSEEDHQVLIDKLSVETWIKQSASTHDSQAFMHLTGSSKAIYSLYQKDLTTLIEVDTDKDGDPELFYSSSDIKWLELKLWVEVLNLSMDHFTELKDNASFSKAFIGSAHLIDQLRQVTFSSEDELVLKGLLDLDQWIHISEIPSLDPIDDILFVLESTIDEETMMLSVYSKNDLSYVVISSSGSLDSYFQLNTSISAAILAFLESLWDAIIPSDDLESMTFSQGYIGRTQYIYETDVLLPEYLFSLSASQNLTLKTLFDLNTWIEVDEPSYYEDAEFALITASGVVLYVSSGQNSYVIRINDHDDLKFYRSDSTNFQTINDTINSYFIPQAPLSTITDAVYTLTEYYEGPLEDMKSPDLSLNLTSAQSKTIKDFLDPYAWRQAYDIPPRGVIIMFSLTDENGVVYNVFDFGPTTALISVYSSDMEHSKWWIGPLSGANSAREYILSIAP